MTPISDVLIKSVRRSFFWSGGLIIALFAIYWGAILLQTPRQTQALVINYTSSVTLSASYSGDVFSIQRQIGLLSKLLERDLHFPTAISVTLDGELVARGGDFGKHIGIYRTSVEESLPSGKMLTISIEIDFFRKFISSLTLLAAGLVVLSLVFFLAILQARSSMLRLTTPLSNMVSWIEALTASLPGSLSTKGPGNQNYTETHKLKVAIDILIAEILALQKKTQEIGRLKGTMELASQVAHDIRSPLAALSMAEQEVAKLPEDTRIMIRSAVGRIRDIANGLLQNNRSLQGNAGSKSDQQEDVESISIQLLPAVIEGLMTEKRSQYRSKLNIEIEYRFTTESYGIFAAVRLTEFKRVLSNLVNNSVEALGEVGKVTITLGSKNNQVTLMVCDNGKGILPEVLPTLMQRGESHGKEGGSGLGLYHARKSVESWKGTLSIESKVGEGTAIKIILPRVSAPNWFVPELGLSPCSKVMILDDDPSIHNIWRARFDLFYSANRGIQLIHCSTSAEVRRSIKRLDQCSTPTVYLFDYELIGERANGLSLIEELQLQRSAILVTSRYDEAEIREKCKKLDVSLIPKGMAGFVPIAIREAPPPGFDAVLIDDDPLIHVSWKTVAESKRKRLLVFTSPSDFFANANTVDRTVPVYIDCNLGNGIKGEEISKQIFELGFHDIYLATGYEPEHFSGLSWLKGVVGKEPPWIRPEL